MTDVLRQLRCGAIAAIAALILLQCGCDSGKDEVNPETSDDSVKTSSSSREYVSDTAADPLGRLAGMYSIDGAKDAAYIVVDEQGLFTAYYASGTVEQKGYVRYEADSAGASGFSVYVFYTEEGNPYMGFVDSGEAKISGFETGNGSLSYVRTED